MKLSYESNFNVGEQIQFRQATSSGWKYYGTILKIECSFGRPPGLTIKLDGFIMPDGDRTDGIDNPENPKPTVYALEQDVDAFDFENVSSRANYAFAFDSCK